MARAQQQGISAVTVWLIVFVALWLTSTVILVVLYTDQEQLRTDRADAIAAKNRAISNAEDRSIPLARQAREGGPTVAGLLDQSRKDAARLATGDESHDVSVIASKRDELIRRIQDELDRMASTDESMSGQAAGFDDVSLFEGFEATFRLLQTEHDLRVEAQQRAEQLRGRLDAASAENAAQKADFEKRAKDIEAQLADAEGSRQQYRAERDSRIGELERQYDELRADCNADITSVRQEKAAWEKRYAEVLERYTELSSKLGTLQVSPQKLATARKPDGRIVMAVPGDDAVYIDLGRRDALVLGMEFAVYSAQTGIPPDGRSKASIRVESISDESAECKVLWVANQEIILESDLIANPVYDRDRALSFVVVGQFDVDRDGRMDRDGALRVEAMVSDWGGDVVDELSALTDFVIVGLPPARPKDDRDLPAELAARNEAVRRNYERYQEVVQTAKTLSIPILTQEVFRNFLGYGGTYYGRR